MFFATIYIMKNAPNGFLLSGKQNVLGIIGMPLLTPIPTLTTTPPPSPTPIPHIVKLINSPEEISEGDTATFTWNIEGPQQIIHSTTVYYGTKSMSEFLTQNASPATTPYTAALRDFIQGDFSIPLRFIANAVNLQPGTYYFRAYALIDGKHYWTDEEKLTVKLTTKHFIKIESKPDKISPGGNATFTWDISGAPATTGFTAIVFSKESKSEMLDTSVTLASTPYTALVKDFTQGNSQVPLRFVGNAQVSDPGTYYFRAIAVINEKNIWSDEHSFTVQ